jgi:hypothetical protein
VIAGDQQFELRRELEEVNNAVPTFKRGRDAALMLLDNPGHRKTALIVWSNLLAHFEIGHRGDWQTV